MSHTTAGVLALCVCEFLFELTWQLSLSQFGFICFLRLSGSLSLFFVSFISKANSKPTFFPLLLRLILNSIWRLKKCLNVIALEIYISNQVAFALKCCVFFFYIAFLQPFMLNQLVFGMIFGGWMKSFLLKFNLNLSNIQNRQQYLILCCF